MDNERSFEAVFEQYYPKLIKYFLLRTQNLHTSEELTSNVFWSVLKHIDNFKDMGKGYGPWIYTIAGNELRNSFKRKKIHNAKYGGWEEELMRAEDEDSQHIEEELIMSAEYVELRDCLAKLSEEEQELIYLRYFAEKSNEELGELYKLKPVSVRSRISRALAKVKRLYKLL